MSELTTESQSNDERFIDYLSSLSSNKNRAALAHLRRGLGKEPGMSLEMYPYVAGWTKNFHRNQERAYFIVAALFGLYPKPSWKKDDRFNNFGKSISFLKSKSDSIELRFNALLNANEEDLPYHLRQMVGLLESSDAPINWHLLLHDIRFWSHEDKFVQRSWAKGFWGSTTENKEESKDSNKKTN